MLAFLAPYHRTLDWFWPLAYIVPKHASDLPRPDAMATQHESIGASFAIYKRSVARLCLKHQTALGEYPDVVVNGAIDSYHSFCLWFFHVSVAGAAVRSELLLLCGPFFFPRHPVCGCCYCCRCPPSSCHHHARKRGSSSDHGALACCRSIMFSFSFLSCCCDDCGDCSAVSCSCFFQSASMSKHLLLLFTLL